MFSWTFAAGLLRRDLRGHVNKSANAENPITGDFWLVFQVIFFCEKMSFGEGLNFFSLFLSFSLFGLVVSEELDQEEEEEEKKLLLFSPQLDKLKKRALIFRADQVQIGLKTLEIKIGFIERL